MQHWIPSEALLQQVQQGRVLCPEEILDIQQVHSSILSRSQLYCFNIHKCGSEHPKQFNNIKSIHKCTTTPLFSAR